MQPTHGAERSNIPSAGECGQELRHERIARPIPDVILRCLRIVAAPQTADAASAVQINADANATLQSFVAQNPSARELGRKAAGVLVFPR